MTVCVAFYKSQEFRTTVNNFQLSIVHTATISLLPRYIILTKISLFMVPCT